MCDESGISKRGRQGGGDVVYAEDASGPFHHLIFTQATGSVRDGKVYVASHWNGNLRAYGTLVPGTVVVLTEDNRRAAELAVPLDPTLRALLLRGFTTRNVVKRFLLYVRARSTIRRLVSQGSFVQIQHVSSFGFLGGMAAITHNKPFYVDMGGTLRDPPGVTTPRPLRSRLARIYYRHAERRLAGSARLLIAVNAHLHQTFPSSEAPKVIVSHSMIGQQDIYERYDACTHDDTTLFVATRLIESKGIQYLLKAMRSLTEQFGRVTLKIAGVGEYLAALRKLTADLSLESHVEFLGGITAGEQLWSQYRQADIVVLPSLGHYEGTPRMIIEAWAAGAPVIATTVGGIPTMVRHEEDGLLVPPRDAPALAAAIKRVYGEAELRQRLITHAYERVRTMTFEARVLILRRAFEEHLPGLLREDR